MESNKLNLLEIVKKRVEFLERVDKNIENREKRVQKLKDKNWFIAEAMPTYKESYARQ